MVNTIIQNLYNWATAVPTNILIVCCVGLVLMVFGKPLRKVIEFIISYFIICFILGLFGISMPPIQDIVVTVLAWIKFLWVSFVG